MAKGKAHRSAYSENPPEWYWVNGLHDACIVHVEAFDFPFDYNKFIGEKNEHNRNCLSLKIDATGAVYDTEVKGIRLFNYKMLTKDVELQGRKKIWWLSDRLIEEDGRYILEIDLQDFDAYPEEFTCKIRFDRAEVVRGSVVF